MTECHILSRAILKCLAPWREQVLAGAFWSCGTLATDCQQSRLARGFLDFRAMHSRYSNMYVVHSCIGSLQIAWCHLLHCVLCYKQHMWQGLYHHIYGSTLLVTCRQSQACTWLECCTEISSLSTSCWLSIWLSLVSIAWWTAQMLHCKWGLELKICVSPLATRGAICTQKWSCIIGPDIRVADVILHGASRWAHQIDGRACECTCKPDWHCSWILRVFQEVSWRPLYACIWSLRMDAFS